MGKDNKVIDLTIDTPPPSSMQSKTAVAGDDDKDVVVTTQPMQPIDDVAYMQLVKGLDLEHQEDTPWTEEEHNYFVEGYSKYSHIGPQKCWKTISKKYVKTKNPKEVQLHGEKFLAERKPKPICTPSNSDSCAPTISCNKQPATPPSPSSSDDDIIIMDNRPVVLALPAQKRRM